MNNDMQVQLLITNCIVADKLYNHWEIAVICFAPAMIVLMRGVQDPEESMLNVDIRSVFCLSFFFFFFEREQA